MNALEQWLSEQVEARDITWGASVTVLHEGRAVVEADLGTDAVGRPIGRDSLFCVRCALVKPALALGLGHLVDIGSVDLDGSLGDHLAGLIPEVASISMRQLVEHAAGLHYTGEIALTIVSPEVRRVIAATTPPRRHDPTAEPVVAGAIGGILVAMVLEHQSGRSYSELIVERVLGPLGLADDARLQVDDVDVVEVIERLALGVGIDGARRRPLLLERTRWSLTDWNPAYGGLATSAALANLYDGVLAQVNRRPTDLAVSASTIDELLTRHLPSDPQWWQPVGFGFVRNARDDVALRYLPPGGFGFSGNRMAFVAAVPAHDLVVSACFVGRHSTDPTLSEMREQRVVELALDLVA